MNLFSKKRIGVSVSLTLLIIALPFAIFFWILPFFSGLTLGNDYTRYPIQHQMELMFSLKMGSFPLYVPGFAGGQSATALTLGQVFHPISHIASFLPGYWNGMALEWNTFLRLIFLGCAQLALFAFLKKLGFENILAFLLSFVTIYHLRMLDLFRYGASLESWTGFIFLCSAIGWYCIEPDNRYCPLFIIGTTYWLICSGHPQMMYFGLIGAGIFTMAIPFLIGELLYDKKIDGPNALRIWLKIGLYVTLGILLSSAYIVPFYFDFVVTNGGHVAQNYSWTDIFRDSFVGTLNNFFQPLHSDVHGVFGGSSLMLLAALTPLLRLIRLKIPPVIWFVWGIFFVVFLFMQGSRTPLHYLGWKYLPFASSMRIAGRISMMIPILFMLLLCWMMRLKITSFRLGRHLIRMSPRSILSVTALLFIGIYFWLQDSTSNNFSDFSAFALRKVPFWVELTVLASGTAVLFTLAVQQLLSLKKHFVGMVVCILTYLQISCLLPYGTWIEPKKHTPSFSQMLIEKKEKLSYRYLPGTNLASAAVLHHAERTSMEPLLGKVYKKFLKAESNASAYKLIEQGRLPDQVIIEEYTSTTTNLPLFTTLKSKLDRVELIYSSFNCLVFNVYASQGGFFGLAYPYSKNWKGMLNHEWVPVYRANGGAIAIHVPEGTNRVEFRYWSPAAFWGMIISCLTLILIGAVIGFGFTKKLHAICLTASSLILSVGLFVFWYQSLYSGQNLGTLYQWKEKNTHLMINLAYTKPTYTSPIIRIISPHVGYIDRFHTFASSGSVVDGDRTAGSGLISNFQLNPFWLVDLHQARQIGSIVIYENRQNPSWNIRPVYIRLSNDLKTWLRVAVVTQMTPANPIRIEFNQPQTGRYVALQASNICQLALDEVEIYPPDNE